MIASLRDSKTITQEMRFERPDLTLVVIGDVTSRHTIYAKVKNLIVFGRVSTEKSVLINTE